MVLSALWIGLTLANSIVEPLVSIIGVAEKVRSGNLKQRVPEIDNMDEIARLGISFNGMLDEVSNSREQLVEANKQLDARREFTEAVLSGVSSGVIGLDKDRKVTLPNMTACQLLQRAETDLIGNRLEEVVPEFSSLMDRALKADPNDFECHRLLCAVHSVTGKYKSAVEHGRKAFDMVPNDPRILQQYGEILLKTGQTEKGCDLTLLAMEYDPVPQGQTNGDKRKRDAVFACLMDDRVDLGLELAEAIEERPENWRQRKAPHDPFYVGGFGSYHPGCLQIGLADGATRVLSNTTSKEVLYQLGNRSDLEIPKAP